ncbi:MAG: hypothetical protein QXH03_10935 [Candidatus Bathyarchaeia archaeon]
MSNLQGLMKMLLKLVNEKLEKINIQLTQKFNDRYSIEITDKNGKRIDTLFTSMSEDDAFSIISSIFVVLSYEKGDE